jgi:hypothetical protein
MSKQGLIYEIVCNLTGERYVGSTFEPTVARRISKHRTINGCSSKTIIERGDYRYGLLETIFINSRDELRMCERKWYDALECINLVKPYVTKEEIKQSKNQYYEDHKEDHKEETAKQKKQYYQDHKEDITKQTKQYYQDHKENRNKQTKQYYQDHKEEINQKQRDKRTAAKVLEQDEDQGCNIKV